MGDRPILFSAEMVRAILEGRKTQTRRVVKPQPTEGGLHWVTACGGDFAAWQDACLLLDEHSEDGGPCQRTCPYGKPGDFLWVREAHAISANPDLKPWYRLDHEEARSSGPRVDVKWRPSIHMPRWASRITLRITDIRVEHLHNISEEDAKAEGADFVDYKIESCPGLGSYKEGFTRLWRDINGFDSLIENPWVWVVAFERVKP